MVSLRRDSIDVAGYVDRLTNHLRECGRRYPQAWRQTDEFRDGRERLGGWPPWCFCPLSGAFSIVCAQHDVKDLSHFASLAAYPGNERDDSAAYVLDVGRVGALAAWRVSQGIYAIDPTVLEAVLETPVGGEIPVDVLLTLPEWCCYVPTPELQIDGRDVWGFFAHLEHDATRGHTELRMLVDYVDLPPMDALSPEIIHLHKGMNFTESYELMLTEMRAQARLAGVASEQYDAVSKMLGPTAAERIGPLLAVLLYLCSQTAEYRAGGETQTGHPTYAEPRKTKRGWRLFAPDRPKVWHVGEKIGKTIRDAMASVPGHSGDDRAGPRPHVRRAHWHSFWTGPRADASARKIVLKWLPPIPVAMVDDSPEARMKIDKLKRIKNLQNETNTTAQTLEGRIPSDPGTENQ